MRHLATILLILLSHASMGQFDPEEYLDLIDVSRSTHAPDSASPGKRGFTRTYTRLYRSPEMGLLNRWELWMRDDGTAVISLRGTVRHRASWLENFFAAMVPASGMMRINDSTSFNYRLAADPSASVHAGWTLGLAYLVPDILPRLDSLCRYAGTRRAILFGHSQGGALACLLTSYLHHSLADESPMARLELKTYASASPKPGNQYYAYDYEFITAAGKAFTVVNTADWVPETPGSVQTFGDLRPNSPLGDAKTLLGSQPWPQRTMAKAVYRSLKHSPEKTLRKFQLNFGYRIHREIRKLLPGFPIPTFSSSSNYSRAGSPVILMPDESYHLQFPEKPGSYFTHHFFEPYIYLVRRQWAVK